MSGRRFIDFDAYWGEQKREPLTIKVFGTPHLLPPSIPAKVVQRITVLKLEMGAEFDLENRPEIIFELADLLFGKKRVADWLENDGMDLDKLGDLFHQTMQAYSKKSKDEDDGDDAGEAEAPTTGSSLKSSSAGA